MNGMLVHSFVGPTVCQSVIRKLPALSEVQQDCSIPRRDTTKTVWLPFAKITRLFLALSPSSHSSNLLRSDSTLILDKDDKQSSNLAPASQYWSRRNASLLPSCRLVGDRFSSPGGKREVSIFTTSLPCCQIRALMTSEERTGNVRKAWQQSSSAVRVNLALESRAISCHFHSAEFQVD